MQVHLPEPKMGRAKTLGPHHHRFLERELNRKTIRTVRQACQTFIERFNTTASRTTTQKELTKI